MSHFEKERKLKNGQGFLVFIPLLGSAAAILFDVGYFTGLNLNYFTFFSLSEHIVFAFEIFPFSLLGVLALALFIRRPLTGLERRFQKSAKLISSILATIAWAFLIWLGFLALAVTVLFSVPLVYLTFVSKQLITRATCGAMLASMIAFAFGYDMAAIYLHPPNFINRLSPVPTTSIGTKKGETINAHLIRSGERGVLFIDIAKNQITLLPWDQIKDISTSVAR